MRNIFQHFLPEKESPLSLDRALEIIYTCLELIRSAPSAIHSRDSSFTSNETIFPDWEFSLRSG